LCFCQHYHELYLHYHGQVEHYSIYQQIVSPFSSWLIISYFSLVPIVNHGFFTWIAPGVVDLHFSLILVTKANIVEGGTTSAA
jgi:hypothetical protein